MELEQINQTILRECLKLGADDVVALANISNSRQVKFVNNEIAINKAWIDTTASVIVVKDKKVAVTSIKECTDECIQDTLKKLFDFTKILQPSNEFRGIAQGPFEYKEIENGFDKKIGNIEDDSIDIVESAINAALGEGAKRCSGVLEFDVGKSALLTSNDVQLTEEGTSINLSLRALLDKTASGHKVICSRIMKDFNPIKAGEDAGRIARLAKNPQTIKSGRYKILFDPLPFANLIGQVMAATPMTVVESGLSFLLNKLDQTVANPVFTLFDDGHISGGLGSSMSDDEGVPTQRTAIIEDGVLNSYLHNTSTAKKYNTKTTANAGIISPRPSNAVVKAGDKSVEEMISEIKRGLYVTNLWYTRFANYMTGDFSTIPRDGIFFIENGKIKYPVKEIRISDNILNLMNNICCLGNDVVQVHGWEVSTPTFTPATTIDKVSVTRSHFKQPAQS